MNKLLQYVMLGGEPCLRETKIGEGIGEWEGGQWASTCNQVLRKDFTEEDVLSEDLKEVRV